jgi:hypothetical protein
LGISFSQGAEWKALINRYIGTIPLSGGYARLGVYQLEVGSESFTEAFEPDKAKR